MVPDRHEPAPSGIHLQPGRVQYNTGPETTGQLVALNYLEQLAGIQQASPPGLLERLRASLPWPLYAVLAVQFALSLRLVWTNTAFQDEGLYLWAGHMEWAHWLDHATIPDFASYFSGAPVVYPPLGAIADSIGGLVAARLLSLVFMLIATCLLWGVTKRLFGRQSAHFAAALFAGLASCQYLGAFATYDAMALFLLALATWLAVRAEGAVSEPLIVMASAAMALADATKYAAALWNPVIIALAVLTAGQGGIPRRCLRGLRVCFYAGSLIALALLEGGRSYVQGILWTTLNRSPGDNSVAGVLSVSAGWVGTVLGLAIIGVVVMFFRDSGWYARLTVLALTVAGFLAPAEQGRIHTIISLFKHVGIGAWFAAAVAGYALASLAVAAAPVKTRVALRVGLVAVAGSGAIGALLATSHYHDWPTAARFIAAVRAPMRHTPGPVAASEETYVLDYYLPHESAGHTFANPGSFTYTSASTKVPLQGDAAYAAAIKDRYFGIVALAFSDSKADLAISAAINRYGGYRLVAVVPYEAKGSSGSYKIWVRGGSSR